MLDSIRVGVGVLVVCGAAFGVYCGHTAHVERQLEADLTDARAQLAYTLSQLKDAEGRLNGAKFDSQEVKHRVADLNSQLVAAADHQHGYTTSIAGASSEAVQLKRERDLYKLTLAAAIAAPTTFGIRPDNVVRELREQFTLMSRAISQDLSQSISNVHAAEQNLMHYPSEGTNANYEWQLSVLKARALESWRIGDDLQSFVDRNKSSLADSGSAVTDAISLTAAPKSTLTTLLADIDRCLDAHRIARCTVCASEDWQSASVTIAEDELLAIAASGLWVGKTGPLHVMLGGMSRKGGNRNDREGLIEAFPSGSLLLRTQGTDLVYEACESVQPDFPGRVEFRVNAKTLAENQGAIEVVMWVLRPLRSE